MNFASWVILGIVVLVVGLAVKATFFSKKPRGCGCGGERRGKEPGASAAKGNAAQGDQAVGSPACATSLAGCAGCTGCAGCGEAVARNAVLPTVREQAESKLS